MAVNSDRHESSSSQMFIGLALWVAALLVVFFLPAAIKAGRHGIFVSIISVLAAGGLFLIIRGFRLRDRAE
jgi:phosphatidylserine synthase